MAVIVGHQIGWYWYKYPKSRFYFHLIYLGAAEFQTQIILAHSRSLFLVFSLRILNYHNNTLQTTITYVIEFYKLGLERIKYITDFITIL